MGVSNRDQMSLCPNQPIGPKLTWGIKWILACPDLWTSQKLPWNALLLSQFPVSIRLTPTYYFQVHFTHFPWDPFTANWLKITIPMVPYSFHRTFKFAVLYKRHRGQIHTDQVKKAFDWLIYP